MAAKTSFLMWGERGLVATFFCDLCMVESQDAFRQFLSQIEFPNRPSLFETDLTNVRYLIEPDFSEFGKPDAVVLAEYSRGNRAVFIVEAKRAAYSKSSAPAQSRGTRGYNSKINGQLELDYRLAMSLSKFPREDGSLREPDWVPQSAYGKDGKGRPRCLKNPAVLSEVVRAIAGLPLEGYFYVTITHEESNPFTCDATVNLPELYKACPSGVDVGYQDCWDEMRSQFGWINYETMGGVIEMLRGHSPEPIPSLFASSYEINRPNMGVVNSSDDDEDDGGREGNGSGKGEGEGRKLRSGKGQSMVYVPQINSTTFLHFSWQKNSCAFRDYSQSSPYEPLPDYRQVSQVETLIEIEECIPGRHNKEEVSFWHDVTRRLNQKHLQV